MVKENNKYPRCRICSSPRTFLFFSASLIVALHVVLLMLQRSDNTPSGRAKRWLRKNSIRHLTSKHGGIVVFLHLPHTGGMTVKNNLNKMDHGIDLEQPGTNRTFDVEAKRVVNILKGNIGDGPMTAPTHFVVLRDRMANLPELKSSIVEWRKLANKHRTTLFVFTIIRDPLDYHVSIFNDHRVEPCGRDGCLHPLLQPTPENLLFDMKPNEQCHTLARAPRNHLSEENNRVEEEGEVTEKECNNLYDWMVQYMDWVGTTDSLKTRTLPLLAQFMLGDADRAEFFQNYEEQTKDGKLDPKSVDSDSVFTLRQRSNLDQQLYDKVKSRYYI